MAAARLALGLLGGDPPPSLQVTVPTHLVIRATTYPLDPEQASLTGR